MSFIHNVHKYLSIHIYSTGLTTIEKLQIQWDNSEKLKGYILHILWSYFKIHPPQKFYALTHTNTHKQPPKMSVYLSGATLRDDYDDVFGKTMSVTSHPTTLTKISSFLVASNALGYMIKTMEDKIIFHFILFFYTW